MKVTCPNCKFTGSIRDELVPEAGRNVGCPKCKEKFFVSKSPSIEKKDHPNPDRISQTQSVRSIPKRTIMVPQKKNSSHEKNTSKIVVTVSTLLILAIIVSVLVSFFWEPKNAVPERGVTYTVDYIDMFVRSFLTTKPTQIQIENELKKMIGVRIEGLFFIEQVRRVGPSDLFPDDSYVYVIDAVSNRGHEITPTTQDEELEKLSILMFQNHIKFGLKKESELVNTLDKRTKVNLTGLIYAVATKAESKYGIFDFFVISAEADTTP